MNRTCPTCKTEYDDGGDSWKRQCYDCWLNYKGRKRIEKATYKQDVYRCHPSVTKEEVAEYIKENKLEAGWGPQEFTADFDKFKIFVNDTNYD